MVNIAPGARAAASVTDIVFGRGAPEHALIGLVRGARGELAQELHGYSAELLDAQLEGKPASANVPAGVDGLFVAGAASFHVPGCRLVDGREEVNYVTAAEADSKDLKACRVCQPSNVQIR